MQRRARCLRKRWPFSGRWATQGAVLPHSISWPRYFFIKESLVLFKEVGERGRIAEVFASMGFISFSQGDFASARALLEESLEICRELDYKWDTAGFLEGLAAVVAAQGEPVRAVRCMSAAQALREAIGTPLPSLSQILHEFTIASARTQLGEQAFDAAWSKGER